MFPKPASDHPNHKWIMLWQSWTTLLDWRTKSDYTDPDTFGMYIYSDFHWYGVAELLENLLTDFEKAKPKHAKAKNLESLLNMWSPIATLGHWINSHDGGSFLLMDDGPRASKLIGLIGCACLNMLSAVDSAGEMKLDSSIKDLGLIISLYLKWSTNLEQYGVDDEDLEWQPLLLSYAMKGDIDLVATGCSGTKENVEEEEGNADEEITAAMVKGVERRFSWTKTVKECKQHHCKGSKLGGESYNIMKMSRKERAGYAFDKKDPLAAFPEKDIREGKLVLS